MTRIFVTGGAGYVGLHAVKELRRSGFEPVIYDNFSTGNRDLVHGETVIEGDLLERARLTQLLHEGRFSAVFHFAARASVPESVARPDLYFQTNLVGTMNLLEAMTAAGIKDLVFSSTAAVYGDAASSPISESTPCRPVNPYGRSKRIVEQVLQELAAGGIMRAVALRYFNAAGADPDATIGERHQEEHHLIPRLLQEALRARREGRRPVATVFGRAFPTPDGTAIRDFVHVTDLAAAHILALKSLQQTGKGGVYNLGTGIGASVLEVIRIVEKITEMPFSIQNSPPRPGDPAILVASAQKIRDELGWQPRFQELSEIVASAWNWESRNF